MLYRSDVEFFLLIVAAGGLALFLSDRRQASRLALLERELAAMRAQLSRRAAADPAQPQLDRPKPAAASTASPGESDRLSNWFERVVAGRLLIWTGGIALAAGGIFLIRHSIALVSPGARMIAAALLGILLIATGEAARRGRLLSGDPRIAQALVGAGIAVLFAAAYGSHVLFGLITGSGAAILIALITGGALILSLRHGAPTAALGLVGGFSAPLLVGEPEAGALPVLLYVALLDAAVLFIAARTGRGWLAGAAFAASLAWTGYFISREPVDALAGGIFAALFGVAASLGRSRPTLPATIPASAALAELALLVGRDDLGAPAWLLFGALAAASLAAAAIRPQQRLLPAVALSITLLLIAWQAVFAQDPLLPWAAALTTLLFSTGSLLAGPRSRAAAVTACAALAGPLLILRALDSDLTTQSAYGGFALLLSIASLGLFWWVRQRAPKTVNPAIGEYASAGTAALLGAVAAHDLASPDFLSGAWLLLSVGLLLAGARLSNKPLRTAGLALLTVTVFKVFLVDAAELEGVLRILSFLGLGVALIGIGLLYGKVLGREHKPAAIPGARSP
ncbi:MAG TPA: DUF2339 domain-containing protein [Allosphingosinicella sp.]|jgi:uncharacterized membrane protein